ncbi:hypothetical protein [Massilia cavernae]|uniref:Uncharacterized protein n=1 Tax=Massilia cavernae TaxID=2320864 RepID=A0A418Y640_9BURK|nr:hypothetical protein [Massilia cavernae]RJG22858.1 hypothetical protein D3872_04980 [Massilia cavernae]
MQKVFNDADFRQFNSWMNLLARNERYAWMRKVLLERDAATASAGAPSVHRFVKVELLQAEWKSLQDGGPPTPKLTLQRGYDANPADLYTLVGPFAPKLSMYGLLHEKIEVGNSKKTKDLRERFLLVALACEELNELVNRAMHSIAARQAG